MKKILLLVLSLALVFSGFSFTDLHAAQKTTDINGDVIDIGTYLRYLDKDEEYRSNLDSKLKAMAGEINFDEETTTADSEGDDDFTFDGGTKYFLGYDNGGYYFKDFTLRSVGNSVEIWVANDLSFPEGDERPAQVVTQEQVDLLRDEFDNNIYPVDTSFFGTPDSHTGENSLLEAWGYVDDNYYVSEDGKERIIMLVDNIRDEKYYDENYPFYIAGFYSTTYESYFDRNIINIDTNNWEERLTTTYFGTTAHEFQHLIHDDNDSMEETWINEGMSDFAQFLCGYGHPWGHINFFLEHPENSLVEWDDHYSAETGPETLADYGQAYLFQLYLNDKYGQEFIRALAKDTDHGFASVEKILNQFGEEIDFEELFRRFSIAVAIDSSEPGDGIYSFDSIDLGVNYDSALTYDKDGVPAWGCDYKEIETKIANRIQNIKIDGIDFVPTPWEIVNDQTIIAMDNALWGNEGNEKSNQIIFKADLSDVDSEHLNLITSLI